MQIQEVSANTIRLMLHTQPDLLEKIPGDCISNVALGVVDAFFLNASPFKHMRQNLPDYIRSQTYTLGGRNAS